MRAKSWPPKTPSETQPRPAISGRDHTRDAELPQWMSSICFTCLRRLSERIHISAPRRNLANETASRHRPVPLEPFGAEFRRGVQKLKGKRPNDAIRLLGGAQQDLALHESRSVRALSLCASAYEQAGLLWAARGSMLLAASQALKEFTECGKITPPGAACVRLIWLELQLGHIACA